LTVSYTDFTFLTEKRTTIEEVNAAFTKWAATPGMAGILAVTSEPLVSSDFKGNTHSAIVDLLLTNVIDGDLVKIAAWYDNEWGYSNRFVEQAIVVGQQLKK
jgi:glyceraldehyde 3-phosphate dehydrogenase